MGTERENSFKMITGRWPKLLILGLVLLCLYTCAHSHVGELSDTRKADGVKDIRTPKVLIIYQSKYGSTRQYARWIQKDIPGDLVDAEKGDKPEFAGYDVIVFGSYIRTGRIVIAPLIVDAWGDIKSKKVVLFTVSGIPPGHPNIRKIYDNNLPEEMRKDIKYFPLRGRILSKDLSFYDKLLVAIGRMLEKDKTLKEVMSRDFDEVKTENVIPVVEYIKALSVRK